MKVGATTMKVLTISDVRKNFAAVVDAVIEDAEECVIPAEAARRSSWSRSTNGTR